MTQVSATCPNCEARLTWEATLPAGVDGLRLESIEDREEAMRRTPTRSVHTDDLIEPKVPSASIRLCPACVLRCVPVCEARDLSLREIREAARWLAVLWERPVAIERPAPRCA